jgi:AcrR family transcriptional regulator
MSAMEQNKEPEAKTRIFNAAVRLFSRKGFNAVGMRELAAEAKVNLAMINYFYGSKHGLLEAILEDFFQDVHKVMLENVFGDDPPEARLRRYIEAVVAFMGQRHEQALLTFTQIPLDDPKITDFKLRWMLLLFQTMIEGVVGDLEAKLGRPVPKHVIGPAMLGAAIAHYLVKPVLEKMGLFEFDEEFYRELPAVIGQIAIHGILSLAETPDLAAGPGLEKK